MVRQLALDASRLFDRALFIVYNDQTGDRYSEYMENGRSVAEFGAQNELYVPLNEKGEPETEHRPLQHRELVKDVEYETIRNAIQLGLEGIGSPDLWENIRRLAATT